MTATKTEAHTCHARATWVLALLAVIGLSAGMAIGCGGGNTGTEPSTEALGSEQVVSPTEVPATQSTGIEQSTLPEAELEEQTTGGLHNSKSEGERPALTEPESFPPPALPVLKEFVFPQGVAPVAAFLETDEPFIFTSGGASLHRLNVDTGALDSLLVPAKSDIRGDLFAIAPGRDLTQGLVSYSTLFNGSLDSFFIFDPNSFTITDRFKNGLGNIVGGDLNFNFSTGWFNFDQESLTIGEPLPDAPPGSSAYQDWVNKRTWIVRSDGSGDAYPTGSSDSLGSFQVDLTSAVHQTPPLHSLGEAGLWLAGADAGKVFRVDPESLEVHALADLQEFFGTNAVTFGPHRQALVDEVLFLNAQVTRDGVRWSVLVEMDGITGEIWSAHTVSRIGRDLRWGDFNQPVVAVRGDRLFVQDHFRRIVEVDRSQLGRSTASWSEPSLPVAPEFTPEEQSAVDAALDFADGNTPAAVTNQEEYELISDDWAADMTSDSDLVAEAVTIDGERAFVRLALTDRSHSQPLVLVFQNDEWLVDTDALCRMWQILNGNPCAL